MKFRINLNPYPGAPYFTVSEHARACDKTSKISNGDIIITEELLRVFFAVPDRYNFTLHSLERKAAFLLSFENVIIRDDPNMGLVNNEIISGLDHSKTLIDLSFSFPQSIEDFAIYDSILIDPNASLGIPANFFVLFSKNIQDTLSTERLDEFGKDLFVMRKVLEDLHKKGKALLLREANYKAVVLYQLIESSKNLEIIIDKELGSKTMISAVCDIDFSSVLKKLGYDVSVIKTGKKAVITIANYPTHSKELIEMFYDKISAL